MHLICPSKCCISIAFSISLWTAVIPRKIEKQKSCKILGGITGDVQVAYVRNPQPRFHGFFQEKATEMRLTQTPNGLNFVSCFPLFSYFVFVLNFRAYRRLNQPFVQPVRKFHDMKYRLIYVHVVLAVYDEHCRKLHRPL